MPLAKGYAEDRVAEIHAAALTVLEELGVRINHDGARALLAKSGAAVADGQVRFGRDMVEEAIRTSPAEFTLTGAAGTLRIGGRNTQFVPAGGPPYAMDTARGKRPGTLEDFRNFVRLAQAFDVIHAAGWLEGGLSASYEKFILDVEQLRHVAELMQPVRWDEGELGLDAIREIGSGGHYFGAAHTLERYRTAFYAPFVSDWSNFGQWEEAGSRTATERAADLWPRVLADFQAPHVDRSVVEAIEDYIARRTQEGGADPVS